MEMVKIELLKEYPRNREFFDDIEGERWQEFVESIRTSGIIVSREMRTYEDRDGLTKEDWMVKDLIKTNLK